MQFPLPKLVWVCFTFVVFRLYKTSTFLNHWSFFSFLLVPKRNKKTSESDNSAFSDWFFNYAFVLLQMKDKWTFIVRRFAANFRLFISFKEFLFCYSADAFINRKDGTFKLTELRLGLIALLNDLHKGRDSGKGWSWLIDVSAGFLTLVSLSGLVMLFFLKKKRLGGLMMVIIGAVLCYLIYWLWVP